MLTREPELCKTQSTDCGERVWQRLGQEAQSRLGCTEGVNDLGRTFIKNELRMSGLCSLEEELVNGP